ncbi:42768_t:CDS:2 [Gigaspora margarita]|uniref:42768_t:CDS:1 n=1 Tax=Gigaspora margarita TaxID=4874 RepID=A0ABM8VVL6_GIGMA|nr:42768_t:CDS:2 [Gigaspora margarita]
MYFAFYKIESNNNLGLVEEQPINISPSDQDLDKAINIPVVEQTFHNWKKTIQTGLDAGTNTIKELENFINSFINNNKKNFIEIENPVVHSRRDTSKKKQFKESHELVSKKKSSAKENLNAQKTRKQTQYQQYQNTGHNKANNSGPGESDIDLAFK